MNKEEKYSPLLYLAALGAGGIAVAFFAFINYTVDHTPGLVNVSQLNEVALTGVKAWIYQGFEWGMIIFTIIHLVLSLWLLPGLIRFVLSKNFKDFINDPLRNSAIVAPLISLTMTINVFLAAVRYFVPYLYENLQSFMLPGLIGWGVVYAVVMILEIWLLQISFAKGFDITKINFGWLLHPFVLGMVTVTGTGIAALSKDYNIATVAAFMTFVSGTMGLFLLLVKLVSVFKSHFAAPGLPDKKFLPSFLIVVPNVTLYAISSYRLAHYFAKHHEAHAHIYEQVTMTAAWAFETWYMLFGLVLLADYFRKYFNKDFTVSQWGLVCPFVAYAVLGSFVYSLFLPYDFMFYFIVLVVVVTILLFINLLVKQLSCWGWNFKKVSCE